MWQSPQDLVVQEQEEQGEEAAEETEEAEDLLNRIALDTCRSIPWSEGHNIAH
jgi:hypothetical protein